MIEALQSFKVDQLSVGSVWQNVAFYLTLLFICLIIAVQLNANSKTGLRAFAITILRFAVAQPARLLSPKARRQTSKPDTILPHSYFR
jgi:hypothetical protein